MSYSGSMYLHCDQTASHELTLVLNAIFGPRNFRNEIIWQRDVPGKGAKKKSRQFPKVHDVVLFYSNGSRWHYRQPFTSLTAKQASVYRHREVQKDGSVRLYQTVQLGDYSRKSIEAFRRVGLIHTSPGGRERKKYYLDEAMATIGDIWTDIFGFGIRSASGERIEPSGRGLQEWVKRETGTMQKSGKWICVDLPMPEQEVLA